MTDIGYLTDEKGRRVAVGINLEKHRENIGPIPRLRRRLLNSPSWRYPGAESPIFLVALTRT